MIEFVIIVGVESLPARPRCHRCLGLGAIDRLLSRSPGREIVPHGAPPRVAFRIGDTQLNVHGPGIDVSSNVAKLPVQPGNSDICFEWPGPIEQARAHLESHGVSVETGPVPRIGARGNGVSIYFRDPDGSLLEFISYKR